MALIDEEFGTGPTTVNLGEEDDTDVAEEYKSNGRNYLSLGQKPLHLEHKKWFIIHPLRRDVTGYFVVC